MEERELARWLAWARVGIGAVGMLMPEKFGRMWTGRSHPGFPSNMMARGLGARDLALGLGTLHAIDGGGPAKPWLQAGALADASDAIGTLGSFKELGGIRALGLLAVEAGAAVVGIGLADAVD